jgi:hypothetical protein
MHWRWHASAVVAGLIALVLKEPCGLVIESLAKPRVVVPLMMPKRIVETDPSRYFFGAFLEPDRSRACNTRLHAACRRSPLVRAFAAKV